MQLRLTTGLAKNDSTLGPVLGQYGVKGVELCNKFNLDSLKLYKKNILIKVFILIFKDRSYQLIFEMPPLFVLFSFILHKNLFFVQDLYKIALIQSSKVKNIPIKIIYRNILNTIKNYNYEVFI